jgi:hypothetical protein
MKIFTWLLTIAFVVVCVSCWAASSWVHHLLEGFRREALPAFTVFVLYPSGWILFCPLPWLIYATALSRRQVLASNSVFIFTGTVVLAATLLLCAVAIASILPCFNVMTRIH